MKATKLKILLIALPILFIACKPDKDDYAEKWIGEWQTTDETVLPQTKFLHTGTIIKDDGQRNQVIMSGMLLGLNSSYRIPIKLSSEKAGSIDYTNGFTIKGSASCNQKDTIWLNMNISRDNKTVYDTITLVKVW